MVIDTTLFYKDFDTLAIRLAELFDVVDMFVICESKFDHRGKKKELYLTNNLNLFNKYESKMRVVIEKKKHLTKIPMIREIHQRKAISKALRKIKIKDSDLIMYSDCDEIPRAQTINELKIGRNVNALLEFKMYTNYLNMENSQPWRRARVVSGSLYTSIEDLRQDIFLFNLDKRTGLKKYIVRVPYWFTTRNYFLWKLPKFYKKPNLQIVPNAGWHFNNLFSWEILSEKLGAYAHWEVDNLEYRNRAKVRILEGKDIFTGEQCSKVEIDQYFPKEVFTNQEKWAKFLYE